MKDSVETSFGTLSIDVNGRLVTDMPGRPCSRRVSYDLTTAQRIDSIIVNGLVEASSSTQADKIVLNHIKDTFRLHGFDIA